MPNRILIIVFATILLTKNIPAATVGSTEAMPATPADPELVMGDQSCVKCHTSETRVWSQTPHHRTFEELHRRPEAKTIASKLGIHSIKNDGRCVDCHYTQQSVAPESPHVIAGVSCESCHGAAKNWIDVHQDYGGEGITRYSETPQHRLKRIASSVSAGMRNPKNVYSLAQSCLRCHTTADEQLVNVGGHSAGSLDFELVSWSQGTIRHNFVRSDGKSNDPSDQARIRVMFVAGMIAELESSLRATAVATEKATYGITVAKRGARAGARLKSVAAKIDMPILDEIIRVFDGVTLKLNNARELTSAADQIAVLGYRFADASDGKQFAALDGFIPTPEQFK